MRHNTWAGSSSKRLGLTNFGLNSYTAQTRQRRFHQKLCLSLIPAACDIKRQIKHNQTMKAPTIKNKALPLFRWNILSATSYKPKQDNPLRCKSVADNLFPCRTFTLIHTDFSPKKKRWFFFFPLACKHVI